MIQTLKELFAYIRQPRILSEYDGPEAQRFFDLHMMLILALFSSMFYMSFLSIFIDLDSFQHQMDQEMEVIGPWGIFIAAVIIAPLMEEYFFRYGMRYHRSFLSSIILALGFTAFVFIQGLSLIPAVIISLSVLVIFIYAKYRESKLSQSERGIRISNVIHHKFFSHAFYFQAIVFGLAHMSNFVLDSGTNILILPLLIVPQLILGLILGFARMKYGFIANLYLHAIYNGILMTVAFMANNTATI